MKTKYRKAILGKLESAAMRMEEALTLAQQNGWPDAFGFVAGEGPRATVCIIRSFDDRDAVNGSPPKEAFIEASAHGWDSGAWCPPHPQISLAGTRGEG